MCALNVPSIKEMVNNNQKVTFRFYRDGQLWYATVCGFEFPVSLSEAGTATFFAQDKAILFMRYIRKHLEYLKASSEQKDGIEINHS